MLITIFYITHLNIVYISTTGVNTVFAFLGIMKRVGEVLLLADHKTDMIECEAGLVIKAQDVTFSWAYHKNNNTANESAMGLMKSKSIARECLRDISFCAKSNELIMIVGPVGCGKSSLFMGLLNELNKLEGELSIKGSIGYASEDP